MPLTGPLDEYVDGPAADQGPGAEVWAGMPGASPGSNPGRPAGSGLRLLPPRQLHTASPSLTADQQAAVDVAHGSGPVLVPGAPGTGKSTVLVEAAVVRALRDGVDPERMLILAPSRLAADFLRDRFTARLD